jgi:hypothetical protein
LAPKERRGAVEYTKLILGGIEKYGFFLERSHLNGRTAGIQVTHVFDPQKLGGTLLA